jgi:SAM-dependent methyltransferase
MPGAVTSNPACPVCTSRSTTAWRDDLYDFEYGIVPEVRYALRHCEACDSGFLWPRPDPSVMASFYPDDYHAYHDDHGIVARLLVGMRSKGRAAYYDRLAPKDGKLFDVGAGDCRHFDALKPHSRLTFSGVDLKPEMVEKARARGYDVTLGMLETMEIAPHVGQYDIVSMNHVIEHVLDPDLLMQRALALLKPGGYVVGQLPTSSCWELQLFGRYWGGHHYPRHLQAISRAGLAEALGRAGFTNVRVMSVPHVQTALSVQNWLIGHGWKPRMRFGKSPIYGLLLLGVLPFEAAAYAAGRCGIVNFEARRPA